MSKDIRINYDNGMYYSEVYWDNGKLGWKGVFTSSGRLGYFEDYNKDGSVYKDYAGYWMNSNKASDDNKEGYCYIWDKVAVN